MEEKTGNKLRADIIIGLIFISLVGLSISVKIYHDFNISKNIPANFYFLINPFLWFVFLSFFTFVYSKVISFFSNINFYRIWKADLISYLPFLFAGMISLDIFAFKYLAVTAIIIKLYYLYKQGIIKRLISAIRPRCSEDIIALITIALMTILISNNLTDIGIYEEDTGTIQVIGERIANGQSPSLEWDIGAPGQPVKYRWDLAMPFTYILVAVVHIIIPTHETILILNLIFFVLFALLLYRVLSYFFDKQIALFTLVLFIFNPQVPWVVRIGLPYIISWSFILLACISYFYARKNNLMIIFIVSGICIALSILAVPFFSFVLIFPVLLEIFSLAKEHSMRTLKNSLRNMFFVAIGGIMVYLFFSIYFYHYANGIPLTESLVRFYVRLMEARDVNVLYAPNAILWPVPLNLILPMLANIQVILIERTEHAVIQLVFLSGVSGMMLLFISRVIKASIKKCINKEPHYDMYYSDLYLLSLFIIYLIVFSLLISVFVSRWMFGYLLLIYIMVSRVLFNGNIDKNAFKKYAIYLILVGYCVAAFLIQHPKYSKESVSPYKQAALYIENISKKSDENVLCLTKEGTFLVGTVYLENCKYLNDEYIKDLDVFSAFVSKNDISFIFYNKKSIPGYFEKFWRRSNKELSLVELFINKNKLAGKIIEIGDFRLVNLE